MLFSSAEVVKQINDNFEPVWESVHPVPIVTVDFGNGKKVTRTLNGNIATYLCTSEGNVLDVIPGLYTPDAYRERLGQFELLHRYVLKPTLNSAIERLKDYHARQSTALKEKRRMCWSRPPGLKASDRRLVKPSRRNTAPLSTRNEPASTAKLNIKADETVLWSALVDDTKLNETIRRQQIHQKIADVGPVKPHQLVKWIYKEVLHADLDDPYLGLSTLLFANYPFAAEEGRR